MLEKFNDFSDRMLEMQVNAMIKKDNVKKAVVTRLKGATAMEYVLIVSIMAGVILVVWKIFGKAIKERMGGVSSEITTDWETESWD